MTGWRAVVGVALADVRQRSRAPVLVAVPVVVAYLAKLASVDATLVVGGRYTGAATAAWYGGVVAGAGTLAFLLAGPVLVGGSVDRDRQLDTAELLATTPLSNGGYLLGKWLSNFAVLSALTSVLAVATAVSFLLQGTGPLDPVALVSPFLLITMPTMALVAAAGICLETVDPLRSTTGTALYLLLAIAAVVASVRQGAPFDVVGISLLRESMTSSIAAQHPAAGESLAGFAYTSGSVDLKVFRWNGVAWTWTTVASRLPVLGVAAGLLVTAVASFNRVPAPGDDAGGLATSRLTDVGIGSRVRQPAAAPASAVPWPRARWARGSFAVLVVTEARVAIRGRRRRWALACGGAIFAATVVPLDILRSVVVPTALLLGLPVWSELAGREHRHRTGPLVFLQGDSLRVTTATYTVGVAVGAGLTAPAVVRYVSVGAWEALVGWAAGVLFLPAAALAVGVWVRRTRVFETATLVAWYAGPMNGFAPLDYVGAQAPTVPLAYLVLAVLAFGVAVAGRRRAFG